MKKLGVTIGLICWGVFGLASAQTVDQMDAQVDQSMGQYSPMNLDYIGFGALGLTQKAWLDPMQNMGEGQVKPAYSRYYWNSDTVLPIRLRLGMITLINFPSWELVEDVFIGDMQAFNGQVVSTNAVMLFPNPGSHVGVDTNMIVFGRSGNRYAFYLRSEGINTEKLTHSIIDIDAGGDPASTVPHAGRSGGVGGGMLGGGSGAKSASSINLKRNLKDGWLEEIPVDPEKFRFDIEVYAINPEDTEIAPERVWRDDIFTYIDFGPKALNMVQRPIVNMIVQKSEVPVGFRTRGKYGRLMVVEGIGDMVLRNGARIICLKLRKDPARGLEMVEYDNKAIAGWDVPPPMVTTAGSGFSSGAAGGGYSNPYETPYSESGGKMTLPSGVTTNVPGGLPSAGTSIIPRSYGANYDNGPTTISVELNADDKVENLERLWTSVFSSNSDILKNYEPYFSVDAPAEGKGREVFRLRVGPIKDLKEGDTLCGKLGRRGVPCSVVRTQ